MKIFDFWTLNGYNVHCDVIEFNITQPPSEYSRFPRAARGSKLYANALPCELFWRFNYVKRSGFLIHLFTFPFFSNSFKCCYFVKMLFTCYQLQVSVRIGRIFAFLKICTRWGHNSFEMTSKRFSKNFSKPKWIFHTNKSSPKGRNFSKICKK